jgi:hypothetical protein
MTDDYRVKTSWRTHHKRGFVESELGRSGVLAVMDLWGFVASTKTDGNLTGMSNRAIAVAAGWPDDPDRFVDVLSDPEIRLLDGEPGAYHVHDHEDHNPWVAGAAERSENSRRAAEARWSKNGKNRGKRKTAATPQKDAESCGPHRSALRNHAGSTDPQCPVSDTDTVSETDTDRLPPMNGSTPVQISELQARCQGWPRWATHIGMTQKAKKLAAELEWHATEAEIEEGRAEAEDVGGQPSLGLLLSIIARKRKTEDAFDAELEELREKSRAAGMLKT